MIWKNRPHQRRLPRLSRPGKRDHRVILGRRQESIGHLAGNHTRSLGIFVKITSYYLNLHRSGIRRWRGKSLESDPEWHLDGTPPKTKGRKQPEGVGPSFAISLLSGGPAKPGRGRVADSESLPPPLEILAQLPATHYFDRVQYLLTSVVPEGGHCPPILLHPIANSTRIRGTGVSHPLTGGCDHKCVCRRTTAGGRLSSAAVIRRRGIRSTFGRFPRRRVYSVAFHSLPRNAAAEDSIVL